MKNYVWCPEYCPCHFEAGFSAIAICSTRAKAREVLRMHKKKYMFEKPRYSEHWRVKKRYLNEIPLEIL